MTAPSPPIVPISIPKPAVATQDDASSSSASALRTLITNVSTTLSTSLSQQRPWSELLDRSSFSKPDSFSEATLRLRKNYPYFRINYLLLLSSSLSLSLLTHPFSLLLLLSLLSAWLFLFLLRPTNSPPLSFLGRTFSERETLSILVLLTVVLVFLTSLGSLLISALLAGIALVCIHGAFRMPEDLFLDEQEAVSSVGFLSFLGNAVSNASAPAAVAAARV
ncbi:hypothetical protein MLD38_021506 [Melastoma candidum]|uniref:Uncharacterized protein n=1 Tax=Melastoma candidum TaxID=119954 RepID=A0ACB9QJ59_9MYRT|nr:hypothetical protein MLD38_021506 [Melastoma candidum]